MARASSRLLPLVLTNSVHQRREDHQADQHGDHQLDQAETGVARRPGRPTGELRRVPMRVIMSEVRDADYGGHDPAAEVVVALRPAPLYSSWPQLTLAGGAETGASPCQATVTMYSSGP